MPVELERRNGADILTLNRTEALDTSRFALHREGLEVEADIGALSYQTKDAAEGMSAFIEKRPPAFRDG